jgi:hypothetical protein
VDAVDAVAATGKAAPAVSTRTDSATRQQPKKQTRSRRKS